MVQEPETTSDASLDVQQSTIMNIHVKYRYILWLNDTLENTTNKLVGLCISARASLVCQTLVRNLLTVTSRIVLISESTYPTTVLRLFFTVLRYDMKHYETIWIFIALMTQCACVGRILPGCGKYKVLKVFLLSSCSVLKRTNETKHPFSSFFQVSGQFFSTCCLQMRLSWVFHCMMLTVDLAYYSKE